MKKTMMAMMAAAVMMTGATAMAAPGRAADCWNGGNAPCVEASYAHCGDGYYGGHRGGRGGYGCGGGYGGGYCYGNENNNEG